MINLQNSQRFVEEYNDFEMAISEIPNDTIRREGEDLLRKLKSAVKTLDSGHGDLNKGNGLPEMVYDSKNKIMEIRKRLSSIVNDWKKVKKV